MLQLQIYGMEEVVEVAIGRFILEDPLEIMRQRRWPNFWSLFTRWKYKKERTLYFGNIIGGEISMSSLFRVI